MRWPWSLVVLEGPAITYFRLRRRACHAPAIPRKVVRASRPPPLDCDCPPVLPGLGELVPLGELWSVPLGDALPLGGLVLGEAWPLGDVLLGGVWLLGEV